MWIVFCFIIEESLSDTSVFAVEAAFVYAILTQTRCKQSVKSCVSRLVTARDFRDAAEGGGFFFQSKSQQTAESHLLKYLATVAYIFLQEFSSPFFPSVALEKNNFTPQCDTRARESCTNVT